MRTKNLIMAVAIAAMPFALEGTADAAAICPNGYISTNPFNQSEQIVIPDGIQQGTSEAQNKLLAQRGAQVYQQKIEETYKVNGNDFSILRDDNDNTFTLCYIPNTQLKRELGLEAATSAIKNEADDKDASIQMASGSGETVFNQLGAFIADINDNPNLSDAQKAEYISIIKQMDEDTLKQSYADYTAQMAANESAKKDADEVADFFSNPNFDKFNTLAMNQDAVGEDSGETSGNTDILAVAKETAFDIMNGAKEKLDALEENPAETMGLLGAVGMALAGLKGFSASNSPTESATGEEAYEIVKGRKRDEELVKRIHGYATKGIANESASDAMFETKNIEQGMSVKSIPYSEFQKNGRQYAIRAQAAVIRQKQEEYAC